jgi:hypothetical protein
VLLWEGGLRVSETQLLRPVGRRTGCPHGRKNGTGEFVRLLHSLVTHFFERAWSAFFVPLSFLNPCGSATMGFDAISMHLARVI